MVNEDFFEKEEFSPRVQMVLQDMLVLPRGITPTWHSFELYNLFVLPKKKERQIIDLH